MKPRLLPKTFISRAIIMMALGLFLPPLAHATEKPSVVSMNLCTDQLVLLLADPEQILSLSYLSHNQRSSVYYDQALAFPTNRGLAEEVYILKPDITVTGTYSNWTATAMLETLGMRIQRFEPAYHFDDIKANISAMGTLLGQSAKAQAIIDDFDARLAALKATGKDSTEATGINRPRAALYEANGYTPGKSSLAHHILEAAGYQNIGAEFGYDYGTKLPLEVLLMTAPDMIILSPQGAGHARAEEMTRHPALAYLEKDAPHEVTTNKNWVCDTPLVLDAAIDVARLRMAHTKDGRGQE